MKQRFRKIAVLSVGGLLALSLTGCDTKDGDRIDENSVTEFSITLNDGTTVPCVRIRYMDGFDCNWDKAVRNTKPSP